MLYIKLFIEREKNIGQSAPECPFKHFSKLTNFYKFESPTNFIIFDISIYYYFLFFICDFVLKLAAKQVQTFFHIRLQLTQTMYH